VHHSGSSAIYPILRDYLALQGYKTTCAMTGSFNKGSFDDQLRDLGTPLFYYGHNPFTEFETLIHRPDFHAVTLNRDPRDVLCSWVFDDMYLHNIDPEYTESMLIRYINEEFKESIEQALLWSKQSMVTVLRFDEMKRDIRGTIIRVLDAARVDKDDRIISELVNEYDFKSVTGATDTTTGQIIRNNIQGFYRDGTSGGWKTKFTPRVKEIFEHTLGKLCSKLGYDNCE